MSFAEIKQQIPELTPEERLELADLIARLSRTDDPQYQADLDQRLTGRNEGRLCLGTIASSTNTTRTGL
jgi:hypothetical protein